MIVPKPEPGFNADEKIRCYTVGELKLMLAEAGLEFVAGYYSLDVGEVRLAASTSNMIVGQKVRDHESAEEW